MIFLLTHGIKSYNEFGQIINWNNIYAVSWTLLLIAVWLQMHQSHAKCLKH